VVDDTFADMARHAMLLLVGRGMTIPPEHRRKPRRSEEPNIVVMVISGGYYLLSSEFFVKPVQTLTFDRTTTEKST
jgi:hypothetical protein